MKTEDRLTRIELRLKQGGPGDPLEQPPRLYAKTGPDGFVTACETFVFPTGLKWGQTKELVEGTKRQPNSREGCEYDCDRADHCRAAGDSTGWLFGKLPDS